MTTILMVARLINAVPLPLTIILGLVLGLSTGLLRIEYQDRRRAGLSRTGAAVALVKDEARMIFALAAFATAAMWLVSWFI